MKERILIGCLLLVGGLQAANIINVPLQMSTVQFMPMDNPTGSTPDPTDPTQFRVSLSGDELTIVTQPGQLSYVLVRSDFSEKHNENYFFALSTDSVSCKIDNSGQYSIAIGCWRTDFLGSIDVKQVVYCDLQGRRLNASQAAEAAEQQRMYIVRVETNLGVTTRKIRRFYK